MRTKNEVNFFGKVSSIEHGKTKNLIEYLKLFVEVQGLKYTDTVPCSAYGDLASKYSELIKDGDYVECSGRLVSREKVVEEKKLYFLSITLQEIKLIKN